DQAIGDGIAEPFLKAVQALLEPARCPIVLCERGECGSKLLGSTDRELAQGLRQRKARTHGRADVVDDIRPQIAHDGASPASTHAYQQDWRVCGHYGEAQ